MGLVATMAALVLGLLVSSAKSDHDTEQNDVSQMAAKVAFLDRVLADYGPEAAEVRAQPRSMTEEGVRRMWPEEGKMPVQLAPNTQAGDAFYLTIQHLSPHDDIQRSFKAQAATLAVEIGQLRALLLAQSIPTISMPLLIVVVFYYQENADHSGQHKLTGKVYLPLGASGGWRFTGRVDVPFLYTNQEGSGNPNGNWESHVGDSLTEFHATIPPVATHPTLGGSLRLVWPTGGQPPFGSEQYQWAPSLYLRRTSDGPVHDGAARVPV